MAIPTLRDLYTLAQEDPTIYHLLTAYERRDITLEQALMSAVVVLSTELKTTRKMYIDLLERQPPIR